VPTFDLACPITGEEAEISLDGFETRGEPAFRGFSCEHESACAKAGVKCALYLLGGAHPFDVKDALQFLGD
jgi:hypothetical protein